jgi:hypothetical protein
VFWDLKGFFKVPNKFSPINLPWWKTRNMFFVSYIEIRKFHILSWKIEETGRYRTFIIYYNEHKILKVILEFYFKILVSLYCTIKLSKHKYVILESLMHDNYNNILKYKNDGKHFNIYLINIYIWKTIWEIKLYKSLYIWLWYLKFNFTKFLLFLF